MDQEPTPNATGVRRISISLPEPVYRQLDNLVDRRGFQSRSQAIAEMISSNLAELQSDHGDGVVAGTLTLFYNIEGETVKKEMARLQGLHIAEVVSSPRVHVDEHHVMEVLILQGAASKLEGIANEFITVKGVATGTLTLVPSVIPNRHRCSSNGPQHQTLSITLPETPKADCLAQATRTRRAPLVSAMPRPRPLSIQMPA